MASDAHQAQPREYEVEYQEGGGFRRFLAELLGEPPRTVVRYPPVDPFLRAPQTHEDPPVSAPVHEPAAPITVDRLGIAWRKKWWIILVSLLAGVVAYVGCSLLPPTYESNATLRVVVQSGTGVSQDAVLASNDLATQYSPLVRSSPVIAAAASQLGIAGGTLSSAVSSGTVGDQNLMDVSAQADTAREAQRRANAVARQFVTYIRASNRSRLAAYSRAVNTTLAPIQREIATLNAQLTRDRSTDNVAGAGASVSGTQATLATLLTARQNATADLAQGMVSAQPQVELVGQAGYGSQVQPKPMLYALVTALAAFLLMTQLVVVIGARRVAAAAR